MTELKFHDESMFGKIEKSCLNYSNEKGVFDSEDSHALWSYHCLKLMLIVEEWKDKVYHFKWGGNDENILLNCLGEFMYAFNDLEYISQAKKVDCHCFYEPVDKLQAMKQAVKFDYPMQFLKYYVDLIVYEINRISDRTSQIQYSQEFIENLLSETLKRKKAEN